MNLHLIIYFLDQKEEKQIGKKSTLIYIGSIVLCSILSGLLFDVMFPGITVEDSLSSSMHMVPHSVGVLSAWALILILLNSIRLNYYFLFFFLI